MVKYSSLTLEMEGLEERGRGEMLSEWGEMKLFWEGGGEALRGRRAREWDERGWEEWEMLKEGERTFGEEQEGDTLSVGDGGKVAEGEMDVRGDVGEVEVITPPVRSRPSKRVPLRGRRRGKLEGTVKEEAERLAKSMANWLCSNQRRA